MYCITTNCVALQYTESILHWSNVALSPTAQFHHKNIYIHVSLNYLKQIIMMVQSILIQFSKEPRYCFQMNWRDRHITGFTAQLYQGKTNSVNWTEMRKCILPGGLSSSKESDPSTKSPSSNCRLKPFRVGSSVSRPSVPSGFSIRFSLVICWWPALHPSPPVPALSGCSEEMCVEILESLVAWRTVGMWMSRSFCGEHDFHPMLGAVSSPTVCEGCAALFLVGFCASKRASTPGTLPAVVPIGAGWVTVGELLLNRDSAPDTADAAVEMGAICSPFKPFLVGICLLTPALPMSPTAGIWRTASSGDSFASIWTVESSLQSASWTVFFPISWSTMASMVSKSNDSFHSAGSGFEVGSRSSNVSGQAGSGRCVKVGEMSQVRSSSRRPRLPPGSRHVARWSAALTGWGSWSDLWSWFNTLGSANGNTVLLCLYIRPYTVHCQQSVPQTIYRTFCCEIIHFYMTLSETA